MAATASWRRAICRQRAGRCGSACSASAQRLKGDAAWAAQAWQGPVEPLSPDLLDGRPLVIDALFGAGLARPIEGIAGEVIDRINGEALTVVAVDVPSGLHGDSGEVMGRAPCAERTVTFFRAKPGHYSLEGLRRCGVLKVADIGIPRAVLDADRAAAVAERARRCGGSICGATASADHKYARGHLTILGGATATGAARLAALAGRRAGAGLVTIATPRSAMADLPGGRAGQPRSSSAKTAAPSRACWRTSGAMRCWSARAPASTSGRGPRCWRRSPTRRAVVLDADAITVFAQTPASLFDAIRGPVLLTPHEGEFSRLFPDLAEHPGKVERARQAARRSGATVLLKGPDTVIAAPDGRAVINVHAPAEPRHGRFGRRAGGHRRRPDGPGPVAARRGAAAAWLHGECAFRFGRPGLIAEDLIDRIARRAAGGARCSRLN